MVVKSVDALSAGKVMGCLYGLFGLIMGAIFSLIATSRTGPAGRDQGPVELLFGVGAIFALPLVYAAIGFLGGMISAALYTLVARLIGGIEIELQDTKSERRRPKDSRGRNRR